MNCPSCGSPVREGVKFCPVCGADLEVMPAEPPVARTVVEGDVSNDNKGLKITLIVLISILVVGIIHQYCIMCAPTTSQFAAIEAVKNGDEDIERMKDEYDRRRRYLLSSFKDIGIECFVPEGAFYAFPNVGRFGLTSEEFCQRLLNEFRCAIVPGTAFGDNGEGFARISYAYSIKHIDQALERIEAFIKTL